ncbi:SDR family oxidoreductase [Rubricoccus marinus]|uniref:NAD-binding protein n=1 Tax=Rubricoccus marinus TaxID=716817 RepID=A0A259U005_9BACT|nr:SDR family oxidoreductase [Rubricoccus marinus]OZC03280.1 NAD-binding protein [Rubricoccus marinus]
MNLDSTVAVVTGASRGIGRATSLALAAGGCHVFGLARSEGDLESLSEILGDRFTPLVADVTDPQATKDAIDRAAEEGGRLDILVNNAGLGRFDPVDEQSLDDWNLQIDTNLSGVFYCTRAAVPHMKAQAKERGDGTEAGHIVHVASIAGLIGNPNLSAYNATKHGLRGFSDATMKELRPFGIRTTCVYPGSVDTSFGDKAGMSENPHAMSPESIADTICHVITSPYKTLISEVVMRPMGARK